MNTEMYHKVKEAAEAYAGTDDMRSVYAVLWGMASVHVSDEDAQKMFDLLTRWSEPQ